MTRKRFKKLMMAEGYSRNEVNIFAALARSRSYEVAYKERWKPRIGIDTEAICRAFDELAEQMHKVSTALCAGFAAFGEAFNESLNGTSAN